MSASRGARPLLVEIAPAFAEELIAGLREEGRGDLAEQVPALRVLGLCGCGELDCASFTTSAPASGDEGSWCETVPLDTPTGIVNVDERGGVIVHVEVLGRPDVRPLLEAGARLLLPP